MNKWIFALACLWLTSCNTKKADQVAENNPPVVLEKVPYSLDAPTETYTLPKELAEISGLSWYKKNKLLCIQDEEAEAFVFDLAKKKVTESYGFGGYGDYEGIEYVDGQIYALKSNGDLFRFKPGSKEIGRTPTDLPGKIEFEGLGYEPKSGRLLLAVKESERKNEKVVYSFHIKDQYMLKEIVLKNEQLEEAGITPKSFKPSGIAVHPQSGDVYWLTSTGKRVLITDRKGRIKASAPLDEKLLPQPEGICFSPEGDLYIATEAGSKKEKGKILKFAR
ncbi:SdiA-regulated domain-containing protein [Tellurirhabdus bombi]|uniref:SdiA-regulated domain-containing protein n=1 Tax=Tellurirhabdus bombi TaxID=2907205 RepID=UPI001F1E4DE6|nr:SdiA-regulated domain-containing protein [Tellurirhabdus bombi]